MKLELFLVLAVVALVPSLSESRNVSKCELRDKLGEVITLNKKFQHKDAILAAVICVADKMSNLNSNLVIVEGIRQPKSTAQPATALPSTGDPEEPATSSNATMAPGVNTSEPVSPSSVAVLLGKKNERSHKKKQDSEETLNDEENKFDSEEMEEDDEHMSREKGGKSKEHKGHGKMTLWSIGKYGIFQLTDSHFCDSGYRSSRNKCNTDCSAFADNDITDDIDCLIKSGYWRHLLKLATYDCRGQIKTFFNDCS